VTGRKGDKNRERRRRCGGRLVEVEADVGSDKLDLRGRADDRMNKGELYELTR
jgi:hypothetical protein